MTQIEVVGVAGLAAIQDGGRPGRMHEGIPPGGALVPELLARANRAVGNAEGEAAIELFGSLGIAARGGLVTVATEEGGVRTLGDGDIERIDARRERRVRYVAVRGGLEVPRVLGGRGTLMVARLGGVEGRGLRKGDRVGVGGGGGGEGGGEGGGGGEEDGSPIRVIAGPDLDRFSSEALDTLLGATFTIAPASDRTGARLVGPPLPRLDEDAMASTPMVAGAIEVPASGNPIVLGPDHPTTGGYPVIAVLLRADRGRFHSRPVGAPVRFTLADSLAPRRV